MAMTSLENFRWGWKLDQDVTVHARSRPVAAGLQTGEGGRSGWKVKDSFIFSFPAASVPGRCDFKKS